MKPLLPLALCSAVLKAQTISVVVMTPFGVVANVDGLQVSQSLNGPGECKASVTSPVTTTTASANAQLTLVDGSVTLSGGATVSMRGAGTASAKVNGDASDVRLRITGGTFGKLVVDGSTYGETGTSGSYSVDIGADGTVEFSGGSLSSARREIGVSFAGQLDVRVRISTSASLTGTFLPYTGSSASLKVTFVPVVPAIQFSPYGANCNSLTLTGVDNVYGNRHGVLLTATGGPPEGFIFFIVGLERIQLSIPNTLCRQLVRTMVAYGTIANAAGVSTLPQTIWGPHPLLVIDAQAAAFDYQGRIMTSNGLELRLQDW